MKIVTEDSAKSPLANAYYSIYGKENVVFANGIYNVSTVINSLQSKNRSEEILAYVDVVLDNKRSVEMFMSLYFMYTDYTNIYIIPIICSEYCFLLSLDNKLGCLEEVDRDVLYGRKGYKDVRFYKKERSLERVFKKILSRYKHKVQEYDNVVTLRDYALCISHHTALLDNSLLYKYLDLRYTAYKDVVHNYLVGSIKMSIPSEKVKEILNKFIRSINQ